MTGETGAEAHYRALESLYAAAPINRASISMSSQAISTRPARRTAPPISRCSTMPPSMRRTAW
jgi:hypothetical protein